MNIGRRQIRNATGAAGMTLVEVLVAVLILTIVVWGAVAFMVSGRTRVELSNQERVAAQIGMEQIERARAAGYGAVGSYDTGTESVNSLVYTWTLTAVPTLADPADANSVYKEVEVNVSWSTGTLQSVTLHTGISP